jgi:acetyl esterase/lipase
MDKLKKIFVFSLFTFVILHLSTVTVSAQYLSYQDIVNLPPLSAGTVISYGPDSLQFAELRIPDGPGPHPVAIVIHGGCFLSFANHHVMDHFCDKLTRAGIATWNLEYRRVDNPGGGWPATFNDIGQGVDYIRAITEKYNLDTNHVVIIGHSSGGYFALWAGSRNKLDQNSQLYCDNPLIPTGVVSLAGLADLRGKVERTKQVCGSDVINMLLGGSIEEVPDRYKNASPVTLLPMGVEQVVIYGSDDPAVPPEFGQKYVEAGKLAGESIGFIILPSAAHFEMIATQTSSWPIVEASIKSMIFDKNDKD